jgi:hypothetical protein
MSLQGPRDEIAERSESRPWSSTGRPDIKSALSVRAHQCQLGFVATLSHGLSPCWAEACHLMIELLTSD